MLIDCGQVAPAVQSGLLPPFLVRVLLEEYHIKKRFRWSHDDARGRIEQYEEAVMCSAVLYRNEMHRASSAKELRELPADVEHVHIPLWKGSAKVDVRELERLLMLSTLDFSGNEIGGKGARTLTESSCFRDITSLNLGGNGVGAEGV